MRIARSKNLKSPQSTVDCPFAHVDQERLYRSRRCCQIQVASGAKVLQGRKEQSGDESKVVPEEERASRGAPEYLTTCFPRQSSRRNLAKIHTRVRMVRVPQDFLSSETLEIRSMNIVE